MLLLSHKTLNLSLLNLLFLQILHTDTEENFYPSLDNGLSNLHFLKELKKGCTGTVPRSRLFFTLPLEQDRKCKKRVEEKKRGGRLISQVARDLEKFDELEEVLSD